MNLPVQVLRPRDVSDGLSLAALLPASPAYVLTPDHSDIRVSQTRPCIAPQHSLPSSAL